VEEQKEAEGRGRGRGGGKNKRREGWETQFVQPNKLVLNPIIFYLFSS
jgi:hypothetical protein